MNSKLCHAGKLNLLILCSILLVGAGCSGSASRETQIPTAMPVAELPTATATREQLPATLDGTLLIPTPLPEAAVSSPTPIPTTAATAAPAPMEASIAITAPEANSDIVMGSDIIVQGLVQLDPAQTAWLSLVSYSGQLLGEMMANSGDGNWAAGFTVPQSVSGGAILQATIRNSAGEIAAAHEVPIHLILDSSSTDRYLALYRPVIGDVGMAGFNLFFDGRAEQPVNSTVTISVWADNCRTQVAKQSFVLNGSGYWQGFVIIPSNTAAGPGCAIASFGEYGQESWREAQIPINILANDDKEAGGIVIGNPPPGSTATAGEELFLYGTALNASNAPMTVSVMLENGRIVGQSSGSSDPWGYWELPFFLPIDVDGPAVITVSAGDPESSGYAVVELLINISPAPSTEP